MIKRLLAISFLVLMAGTIPIHADANTETNNDSSIRFITAFHFLDDIPVAERTPDNDMTREMAAAIVSRITGETSIHTNYKNGMLEDVSEENIYANHIVKTIELGLMSSHDGKFLPKEKIQFCDAVVIMVRATGYEPIAKYSGGYPSGYMSIASQNGMLNGIKKAYQDTISLGEFSKLIYNTINTDRMVIDAIGQDAKYSIHKNSTILSEYFHCKIMKGIITANENTGITGPTTILKNQIEINKNDVYFEGDTDVAQYLGYYAELFVQEINKGEPETVIYFDIAENDTLEIAAQDILEVDNKEKITYIKGETQKKITISHRSDIIYNDVYLDDWTDNDLIPTDGSIKLIDNDNDGIYNVVFINDYSNYVVDYVSTTTSKVADKYGKEALELDDEEKFTLTKGAKNIKLSELKEWDILTVQIPQNAKNTKKLDISVTSDKISGTVVSAEDEWIQINQQDYKLGRNLIKAIQDHIAPEIKFGITGDFYLDCFGNIAAYKSALDGGVTNTGNYAYLMDMATEKSAFNTGLVQVKLFMPEGNSKIYDVKDNVRFFDGMFEKIVKANEMFKSSVFRNTKGDFKHQLIMYQLDIYGKVELLYLAKDATDSTKFSCDVTITDKNTHLDSQYMLDLRNNRDKYLINPNKTIIFAIPDLDANGKLPEEDMAIIKVNELPQLTEGTKAFNNRGYYTNAKLYDLNNANTAAVMVLQGKDDFWTQQTNYFIVSNMIKIADTNGEMKIKLNGVLGNNTISLIVKNDVVLQKAESVQSGDILQVILSSDKSQVLNLRKVFSAGNAPKEEIDTCVYLGNEKQYKVPKTSRETTDNSYGAMYSIFFVAIGVVTEKSLDSFLFDCNYNEGIIPYNIMSFTNIHILNLRKTGKAEITNATQNDIAPGDILFINAQSSRLREIVIIKK